MNSPHLIHSFLYYLFLRDLLSIHLLLELDIRIIIFGINIPQRKNRQHGKYKRSIDPNEVIHQVTLEHIDRTNHNFHYQEPIETLDGNSEEGCGADDHAEFVCLDVLVVNDEA